MNILYYLGHCPIKVTEGLLKIFSPFATKQTVKSYSSALAQDNETLCMFVFMIIIYNIYEYRYARNDLKTCELLKTF